jgi:hypothetical protein
LHVDRARQEHCELVAAETGGEGPFGHLALEALGEPLEERIADLVAKAVIDLLETVEVEQE